MPSSRGSLQPRDQTQVSCVSCIAGRIFTTEPLGKPSALDVGVAYDTKQELQSRLGQRIPNSKNNLRQDPGSQKPGSSKDAEKSCAVEDMAGPMR